MKKTEAKNISYSKQDERRYFRVDDRMPLDYELVPKEKLSQVDLTPIPKDKLSFSIEDCEGIDPNLLKILETINDKLNFIIKYIFKDGYAPEAPPIKDVNISAGGIRFKCEEEFCVGDILKVTLGFPPFPYRLVAILTEVVWIERVAESEKKCFIVGVKFLDVEENLRNAIIRYLFEVQRREIKEVKINI